MTTLSTTQTPLRDSTPLRELITQKLNARYGESLIGNLPNTPYLVDDICYLFTDIEQQLAATKRREARLVGELTLVAQQHDDTLQAVTRIYGPTALLKNRIESLLGTPIANVEPNQLSEVLGSETRQRILAHIRTTESALADVLNDVNEPVAHVARCLKKIAA